jgi:RNA polymerase sigma factor (sigma-70 family)
MPIVQTSPVVRYIRKMAAAPGVDLSDSELLSRFAAASDQAAFAHLMERHGPMIWRVCRRILQHTDDAEDAFQATFIVLLRKARFIRTPDLLGNWLYGVASRTALRARTQRRARERRRDPALHAIAQVAEDRLLGRELREILDEEINRLPMKLRLPFVLCYLEGRTNEEAARSLRCPKGTVLSRLSRARERLRRRLLRRGVSVSGAVLAACLSAETARAVSRSTASALTQQTLALLSAGDGTTSVRSAHAIQLAEGVIKTMFLSKLKFAGLTAAVVVGVASAGLALRSTSAASAETIAVATAGNIIEAEARHPEGWGGGSNQPGEYEIAVDEKTVHGGKASASIKSMVGDPKGFGTLTQMFKADDYRGKRLRLAGYLKAEGIEGGAGLWVRIDGKDKTLAFDNMQKRQVKGTTDWTKCQVVLDVKPDSRYITFGALLSGKGRVWIDDLQFDVVGMDVPTTNMLDNEIPIPATEIRARDKPVNLDFEGAK